MTLPDASETPPAPPAPPPPGGGGAEHLEALNEIARIATLDLELRPMLQRITDALHRRFGWEFVACILVDPARERLVCEAVSGGFPGTVGPGYSHPLESGVIGEVARTGVPVLLDERREPPGFVDVVEETRSELCVPVRHGGKTVAILNAESRLPAAFHGQLPLLETVAEQVAGAIASARVYEEARHRARLLELVAGITRAAMEAGRLQRLLDRVVESVHREFPPLHAAILLVDLEREMFQETARAGGGRFSILKGSWWPLARGVVGRCVRTGQPQLVLDVHADPDYVPASDRVTAEYAVPVVFQGRILGVLNLESRGAEVFAPENLTVFQMLADQLAGAIHLAAMNRALEEANERLRQANGRLERLSLTDALTELPNRRHFDEVLQREWRRARRAGSALSAVMVDLDFFKAFNDSYGHAEGDECLRRVARTLRAGMRRAGDVVARYGGEEFVVLLPDTTPAHAASLAERLRARVESLGVAHRLSGVGSVVTCSAGVSTALPAEGGTAKMLLEEADRALYLAKRDGRNRVRQWNDGETPRPPRAVAPEPPDAATSAPEP